MDVKEILDMMEWQHQELVGVLRVLDARLTALESAPVPDAPVPDAPGE
jgi:hypothetical protein